MGLFNLLKGILQPKQKIEWPSDRSFVGLFLFNPGENSFQSLEAVHKHAEVELLSNLSTVLDSSITIEPLLFACGPFMLGTFDLPLGTPSCVQVLQRVLAIKDGSVETFDLRREKLPHFSFKSYLVCLMPIRKEQIRKLHRILKGTGTKHYAGAVSIGTSLKEAVELTTQFNLGLLKNITSESIGKSAL